MLETVRSTIAAHDLLPRGQRIVVAVSGGPDSVALLHILWTLQEEFAVHLHLAHLNHRFRGPEADADADYVADLARRWGIPATLQSFDVPRYQREHRLSAEQAARAVRHTFLRRVAAETGATRIALGHTADDRVETFLLNLLRGAGVEGLGSLPARRDPLIRPLLDCWRSDTEAYCAQHGLAPRQDRSNLDRRHLRNRIRWELLPLLERDYAPGIKETLRRTAELAHTLGSYLQQRGAEELAKIAQMLPPDGIEIDIGALRNQPTAMQWQILREMIRTVKGNLEEITCSHIEALRRRAAEPQGSHAIFLPGGWVARQEYDRLYFGPARRWEEGARREPGSWWALQVPGITELPELGWRLHIVRRPPPSEGRLPPGTGYRAYLDAACCKEGLWVRTWQPGDRMRPLGLGGTKSLQDIFTDRKVPRRQRPHWPLVVTPERIAWVVGYTIEEAFRVTERTQEVLEVEAQPLV